MSPRRTPLLLGCALALGLGAWGAGGRDLAPGWYAHPTGAVASTIVLQPGPDLRIGLGGWWRLADGTGTSATDSSGLARHGTHFLSPSDALRCPSARWSSSTISQP
ncbi:hypothetical protein [Candidatus Thiodictyon syntrophicum]|uniref:hypothetical protein n=1 Tax=Candidatus Thiodictyon syntrophicum TaxID=1166950 RepID=UPI001F47D1F2|nr:hypothetical protein [Candidatus Thiodictyon syntrophicum]